MQKQFKQINTLLSGKQPANDKSLENSSDKTSITSEIITSKISLLRAVVAPNVSEEKGVVNPKMSAEEKKTRLDIASQVLQSSKIKDITD